MKVSMNVLFDSHEELAVFAQAISKLPIKVEHTHDHGSPQTSSEVAPAKNKTTTFNDQMKAKAEKVDAKPKAEPEAPAKSSEKSAEPEKAAPVEKSEDKAEDKSAAETKGGPLEPTYENMKKAVLLVNRVRGREPTEAILKKYEGAKNGKLVVGPHIPEKFYAEIIAECNKVLS